MGGAPSRSTIIRLVQSRGLAAASTRTKIDYANRSIAQDRPDHLSGVILISMLASLACQSAVETWTRWDTH